ncbi:hypothetical protein [Nonomuraea sp. NPDC050310]|uniref:hypothetical protein n=1 Tax=Nonomuraea sp. NPDC050310 TaxID=3154935 RepID=UPI00340F9469
MHVLAASSLVLGLLSAPAAAPTQTLYGVAWADGAGHLRITPMTATYGKPKGQPARYALKHKKGAKEIRLDYTGAAFSRVYVECHLKESEGQFNLDKQGFGKTRCPAKDIGWALALGPETVRIEYRGGKAIRVREFLNFDFASKTQRGQLKRLDDNTLLFNGRKLGYNGHLTFYRVTAKCNAGWLTGEPVNADRNGLGKKACSAADLNRALKGHKYTWLAQVEYYDVLGMALVVREVFGDA